MEQTLIFNHTPVMLNECIDGLNIKPNGIYVDGTLGGAGHSRVIASKLKSGKLICIDKDDDAIKVASERLKDYDCVQIVKSDFKQFVSVLDSLNIKSVDGVLLDLGVSSYQLDTADRGFSYRFDAPLDMRMDRDNPFSAYAVVNDYSEEKLAEIFFRYGEEPFARKVAREIVVYRKSKPIETTGQLVQIIEKVIFKKKGSNPCTKVFQAIRIEVNKELEGLEFAINQMIDILAHDGRLAIITFHSLEDRVVKTVFKDRSTDCICDKTLPFCVCNHKADAVLVNKKPIEATKKELEENSRSSSAKLRVLQKIKI